MTGNKELKAIEKREHYRNLLLAYHASAIETLSAVELIVKEATQYKQKGILDSEPGNGRDNVYYLAATAYDALCADVGFLRQKHIREKVCLSERIGTWEEDVAIYAKQHPRDRLAFASARGIREAVQSIEKCAETFFEDIAATIDKDEEEDLARRGHLTELSVHAEDAILNIEDVHQHTLFVTCDYVIELARSYRVLKNTDQVIRATKEWRANVGVLGEDKSPPFRARNVRKLLEERPSPI